MLTEQERQRIEDEERKRIAEEQYRAEVRGKLQATTATSQPHGHHRGRMILLAVAACSLVALGMWTAASHSQKPPTYVPVSLSVASGQIAVPARDYVKYDIQVLPEMRQAHVVGTFEALGGSGNDIAAVIAKPDEFQNWINGPEAKVYYSTHDRETTGTFDVQVGPGSYVLGFSNRFSALSAKEVTVAATLKYNRVKIE
jgi:hypothetical protein